MAAESTGVGPVAPAACGGGTGRRPPPASGPGSTSSGEGPAPGTTVTRFRGRVALALALAVVVLVAVAGARWVRAASRAPLAAVPSLAGDSVPTLLVVLRPADCESHRPLVAAWDRVHHREDIRVVGAVLDGPGTAAARDSLDERLGVAFPLRHDLEEVAERLALRLGYGLTPLSVLLDRRGRPRAVVPPAPGRGPAEAASRVAAAHLEMLGGPEGAP